MKLHSTKNTLLAFLALTTLTGCDDPQREAKLKWREEEVNAKELDVARSEALVTKEKQIVESTRLDLLAKQKSVELLQKQAAEELEKTKRSRREFEIKNLRGPLPQHQR
jgi:serine-type D-Ala-D-Ala carboxypeptidase (penicillin-binding protein 5/6)